MKKLLGACVIVGNLFVVTSAFSATVNVNLSGASTGTLIDADGASFAQTFAGQTVAGTGLTGSPINPLTLAPSGTIEVAFFSPGVSPASNSLLSQPGNSAPLAILLDSLASSITFTAGSADGGNSISVNFYDASGAVTGSTSVVLNSSYSIYTIGIGTFAGLSIFDNNDGAGLRFMNFSYETQTGAVPEPSTWAMIILGFAGLGFMGYRRSRKDGGAVAAA